MELYPHAYYTHVFKIEIYYMLRGKTPILGIHVRRKHSYVHRHQATPLATIPHCDATTAKCGRWNNGGVFLFLFFWSYSSLLFVKLCLPILNLLWQISSQRRQVLFIYLTTFLTSYYFNSLSVVYTMSEYIIRL